MLTLRTLFLLGPLLAFGLASLGPAIAAPGRAEAWFEDVTEAVGISFLHQRAAGPSRLWFPEIMSGGGCWLDFDQDGDLDLYLVQGGDLADPENGSGNELYENRGDGTFLEIARTAGVDHRGYGMGCAVGDFDGDGDEDLYVTNVGKNVLFRNEGKGPAGKVRFRDVASSAGVDHPGWGTSAAFLDYEGDGHLDLFLVNYVRWSPEQELRCFAGGNERDYCQPGNYNAPAPDVLYRNNGSGTLIDKTSALGLSKAFGNGLGVTFGDFDRDGRLDLYVANDGDPNQLWMRNDQGAFTDRALLSGCAVNRYGLAEAGMGVAAVDLEADGDLDLFVTHLRDETHTLYLNQGGWFEDATVAAGLASSSIGFTGFGLGFADFDHDGELDLYIANGRIGKSLAPQASDPYAEPDQLFRGLGGGRFKEVEPRGGTSPTLIGSGRAAALGDYDGDGDIDVLVVNNGARARLLRNRVGARRSSVSFRVRDRFGGQAIGAVIRLTADAEDGEPRWRLVRRAGSYLASHDPLVHFGLGPADRVREVLVVWPGREHEIFGPFQAGSTHELIEGQGKRPESTSTPATPESSQAPIARRLKRTVG